MWFDRMNFIQTRLNLSIQEMLLLAELLGSLNQSARTSFASSLPDGTSPAAMPGSWARGAGVFESASLTSDQQSGILRKARALRRAANVKAKHVAGSLLEKAARRQAKIDKSRKGLSALQAEIKALKARPMIRPEALALQKRDENSDCFECQSCYNDVANAGLV